MSTKKTPSSKAVKTEPAKAVKARAVKAEVKRSEAAKTVGVAQPAPAATKATKKSRQRVPKSVPGADGSNPFRASMRRNRAPEPATLVIFGVTGDLARRKLLPATSPNKTVAGALGALATRGENGVLAISPASLARVSSNPFLPWMLGRIEAKLSPAPVTATPAPTGAQ